MRTPFNPYGGVNPLIDKMIGNAYDIVKYVAKYLKEIRYVAENMENVFIAANGNRVLLQGNPGGDTALAVDFPEALDASNILSITVLALTAGGNIYTPGADTFNFGTVGSQVVISIDAGLVELHTADFKIQLITDIS